MSKVLKADRKFWQFCQKVMFAHADIFKLPLKKVKVLGAEKDFYGDCSNDGRIRVQLRRGQDMLLPYQIIDTMAHELAHLRHNNHRPAWFRLHVEILSFMEERGVFKQLRRLHKKRR